MKFYDAKVDKDARIIEVHLEFVAGVNNHVEFVAGVNNYVKFVAGVNNHVKDHEIIAK